MSMAACCLPCGSNSRRALDSVRLAVSVSEYCCQLSALFAFSFDFAITVPSLASKATTKFFFPRTKTEKSYFLPISTAIPSHPSFQSESLVTTA